MFSFGAKALVLANAVALATADIATWPSSYDEIEDLMVLNTGFSARNFPGPLVPCNSARVPGFSVAAGFLRTAFHDMAPADAAAGTGGLDASIGFELDNPYAFANRGPAFNNTVTYLSRFYNSRASMADLIALGTYASVRACGGPVVPIRAGRVDATQPGSLGVPDARDNGPALTTAFTRMGLTQSEGISLVACGHTLGGVHSVTFSTIVPAGTTPLGTADFDTTNSTFDNKVVTQYLDGSTTNPMVIGPDTLARSDARVFSLDNNATVSRMADSETYRSTCATVLQKMIDTVPRGVQLTSPITPYGIKPSLLQVTLVDDDDLAFTGQLRLKLDGFAKADVATVSLVYKDREGGSSCGDCKILATEAGEAAGFDDSFVFYQFSATISAKTSISAFNVIVTMKSGSTKSYDNNGKGYPVQDKVFVQAPNSSLAATNGSGNQKLTVVALVRNGGSDASLVVSTINPLAFNQLPTTSKSVVSMTKGCQTKYYTYYSATFDIPASQVKSAKFDVVSGSDSDAFKSPAGLPAGQAVAFSCSGSTSTSTTTSSTTSSISSSVSIVSSFTTSTYLTPSGIFANGTTSKGYISSTLSTGRVSDTTSKVHVSETTSYTVPTASTSTSAKTSAAWVDWKWPAPSASADPVTDGEIDWSSKKNTTIIVVINENWIGEGSNDKDTYNSGKPQGFSYYTASAASVASYSASGSVAKTSSAGGKTGVSASASTSAGGKPGVGASIGVSGKSGAGASATYGTHGSGTSTSTGIISKYTGAASTVSVSSTLGMVAALIVASIMSL